MSGRPGLISREMGGAPAQRILVADGEPAVLATLRFLLEGEGYAVEPTDSPLDSVDAVRPRAFSLALIGFDGGRDVLLEVDQTDLLARFKEADDLLPVVVMTTPANAGFALKALDFGAQDYLLKPWETPRLFSIVRNQLALCEARRECRRLAQAAAVVRDIAPDPRRESPATSLPAPIPAAPRRRELQTWKRLVSVLGQIDAGQNGGPLSAPAAPPFPPAPPA